MFPQSQKMSILKKNLIHFQTAIYKTYIIKNKLKEIRNLNKRRQVFQAAPIHLLAASKVLRVENSNWITLNRLALIFWKDWVRIYLLLYGEYCNFAASLFSAKWVIESSRNHLGPRRRAESGTQFCADDFSLCARASACPNVYMPPRCIYAVEQTRL